MRNEINNENDLMSAISDAIREFDLEKLDSMSNIVRDWMQMPESTKAQLDLIDSAYDVIEKIIDLEG